MEKQQTSMISFRMDSDLKNIFSDICEQLGLTTTAAFTMFAVKVIQERAIPFDIKLKEVEQND